MEDYSWLTATELWKYAINPENLKNQTFLLREFDAGASEMASNVENCPHVVADKEEFILVY